MKLSLEPEGCSVSRQQVVKVKGSLSTSESSESESSTEGESTEREDIMQLASLEQQVRILARNKQCHWCLRR